MGAFLGHKSSKAAEIYTYVSNRAIGGQRVHWTLWQRICILKMELEDMGLTVAQRGIYEVSFGHHSELHGYTALMSDMMKLSDIVGFESF